MIAKYKNLTEQEIETLKKLYYISYKDPKIDEEETKFLLSYREKLFEGVEYIWESNVSNSEENKNKAIKKLKEVVNMVSNYMKSVTAGNIKQRMLFINNIDKEFFALHSYIQWALHKYSFDNSLMSAKIEEEIKDVIKLIAVNQLEESCNIDKLIEENAHLQIKSLKNKLKNRFMSYIDYSNISYYDNYFLIGECLNQISELDKKEELIRKNICEDCLVDDCAISRCQQHDEIIRCDKERSVLNRVVAICANNLHGEPVNQEELDVALKKLKNEDIKKALIKLVNIPPTKTRIDRSKKVEIGQLTRFPELIDRAKIKNLLAETLEINEDKKYYENLNLIVTSLLLTRCDYSGAKGEQIVEKFNHIKDVVKSNKNLSQNRLYLQLIKDYNNELKEKENE